MQIDTAPAATAAVPAPAATDSVPAAVATYAAPPSLGACPDADQPVERLAWLLGYRIGQMSSWADYEKLQLDPEMGCWTHTLLSQHAAPAHLRWWWTGAGIRPEVSVDLLDLSDDCAPSQVFGLLDHKKGAPVVHVVSDPVDVLVLRRSDRYAICLTPAFQDTLDRRTLDDLADLGLTTFVVIAPAGVDGSRWAQRVAAEFKRVPVNDGHGNTVEADVTIRGMGGAAPAGYGMLELWLDCERDRARLKGALAELPAARVQRPAPDGFYVPVDLGELSMPDGFVMGKSGVWANSTDRKGQPVQRRISIIPLWIDQRLGAVTGADSAFRLCGEVGGRVIRRTVMASELLSATKLPALADSGFLGCTSEVAGDLVRYLSAFISANLSTLPEAVTTDRVGTILDEAGEPIAFVHGATRYSANGTAMPIGISPASRIPEARFRAFATKGDAAAWAEILRIMRQRGYSYPYAAICVAVGSLLNRPLGQLMPHICQLSGEAAGGKTTSLAYAMSTQGAPGAYGSMRSTDVALELNLAFHNDLAACWDETQSFGRGARQNGALEDLVYMVSEPSGKDRGAKGGGLRERTTRRGNVIMTGELDITTVSETGNSGAKTRVLALTGEPFGARTQQTAADIATMDAIVARHYGHAVPAVGRYLLGLDADGLDALIARHAALRAALLQTGVSDDTDLGMASRMATLVATDILGGELLVKLFPSAHTKADGTPDDLPTPWDMLLPVWRMQLQRLRGAPRSERSMDIVRRYFASRKLDFEGVKLADVADGATRGRETVGRVSAEYVAFLPEALSVFLAQQGFPSLQNEVAHWDQRGWIVRDGRGKASVPVTINRTKVRCVAIRRAILDAVDDGAAEPAASPAVAATGPAAEPLARVAADGDAPLEEIDTDGLPF